MSTAELVGLAVVWPLFGAVLVALLGRWPNIRETASLATAGSLFAMVAGKILPEVLSGARPRFEVVDVLPGLTLAFEVEPLGMLFALVASGLWIVTTLYAIGYMRGHHEENQTRFYVCFAFAISGAVGTYANLDPAVERHVATQLGLQVEPVSTQVIPRDRHAMFFATLAVIASSVERLATEIRHLQRTEVREVEEFFSPGQKGSSAMPHKRNPILTENLTGLARTVRAAVVPALENVALWHERDISHSSVERMIGPDATVTLDFALARLVRVVDKLVVYPDAMQRNLEGLRGLIFSQRVLLALTQAGMSREDAYQAVQRNAMKVWEAGKSFIGELKSDPDVSEHMDAASLERLFDLGYHTKHVDTVFSRVFGET